MNTRKIVLIVLIIILCAFAAFFDVYYQSLKYMEVGNDYASVENLLFFVNKPQECKWVKGLGDRYLNQPLDPFQYETTVVLMNYKTKEDIQFINAYNFSPQGFKEDLDELNAKYKRLLNKISDRILQKNWKRIWFKWDERLYSDYTYLIYTCENEVLIIAESNHTR